VARRTRQRRGLTAAVARPQAPGSRPRRTRSATPRFLIPLAIAGLVGYAGNEIASRIRLRAGERLDSPALIADGHHAQVDGYVSLGVVASASAVALGLTVADPLIGLAITLLILRITWQAWRTVSADADLNHCN